LSLVTPAPAATHITGTYDLGANPRVMTTVGGTPEYGLVFAQRNKAVTYNNIEYGTNVVKGYLNVGGQLNDGAGNLWIDLIPNAGAMPSDSYYVVTINIQGHVHAEIWVVPDVASVAVEAVRQVQPPGGVSSPFDLANATGLLSLAHGGTSQSSWTAARCVRVNNTGTQLESASGDCGTGGGSAPIASATVSGTVKTDATESDPVVYLRSSADTLLAGKASSVHTHSQNDVTNLTTDLAGKVPTARSVSTSSPLSGGGALSSDLTLSCPTCEVTGNKNAASGYAGLTAGTKLNAAQGQEVWSVTDLTDFTTKSGTGTTALGATVTSPAATHYLGWSGSDWVNRALASGELPAHNHSAGDVNSGTFGFVRGGTNQTAWTAARCVRVNDAGTALESAAGDCGVGGGGGDNISVNGVAVTDADFDDATPAAESGYQNVKFQKDASSPANISAEIPFATGSLAGTVSTAAQTFAGTKTFASDLQISTDGSTEGAPRVGAFANLSSGEAARFQFGDSSNAFQSGYGKRVQIYSWWGLELLGSRQSDAPTFVSGGSADPGLSVINTTPSVPALIVKGAGSQSGDLQRWVNSSDTTLAKVDASGNLTSPIINATTGFRVNGAAASGQVLRGNGTNIVLSADTREILVRIGSDAGSALVDGDDEATVFRNSIAAMTITEVWCESDAGTPSINLQRDDGSAANILSSNLSCSASGATGSIDTNEDNLALGDKIDFVMATAGGTAKRVTVAIKTTID
jgi:hypothetical protein